MNANRLSLALLPSLAAFTLLLVMLTPRSANAYPWMIRHGYTGCAQCHADPSGGGLLTAYGRALGETTMRTAYGSPVEDPKKGEFLFGALKIPDSLLVQGALRYFYYRVSQAGSAAKSDHFLMQADLASQATFGRFRVNGSIGYVEKGAVGAAISDTKNPAQDPKLLSRVHWVGYDLDEDKTWLLRAGRMNLPFGIRQIEHTLMARCYRECGAIFGGTGSRTDTNDAQQHGVSLSFAGESTRLEVMLIAGNYQVYPDRFRDRGYAGFFEYSPMQRMAVGVSSLAVHVAEDPIIHTAMYRHAHGVFGRWSPVTPLVLLTEVDLLADSQQKSASLGAVNAVGVASYLQADLELIQGLHLMGTSEFYDKPASAVAATPPPKIGPVYAGWATLSWFFLPHVDARVDAVWTSAEVMNQRSSVTTLMAQLHAYL